MSAVSVDAGTDLTTAATGPDEISRRLESLPASSRVWRLVILLSLGGCFEIYDLFFTGYIAPGLNRSGLLTTTTQAFFGFSGIGPSSRRLLPDCSPAPSSWASSPTVLDGARSSPSRCSNTL
jgi:hypothetical protein